MPWEKSGDFQDVTVPSALENRRVTYTNHDVGSGINKLVIIGYAYGDFQFSVQSSSSGNMNYINRAIIAAGFSEIGKHDNAYCFVAHSLSDVTPFLQVLRSIQENFTYIMHDICMSLKIDPAEEKIIIQAPVPNPTYNTQIQRDSLVRYTKGRAIKSINPTQQNLIEGTMKFIFDEISELKPRDAIESLRAITAEDISSHQAQKLISLDVMESIKQARSILLHPYPQTGSTSYPYFGEPRGASGELDTTMIVYKDAKSKPKFERKGMLSLTTFNDDHTFITKEAVVSYIHQLVDEQIAIQHKKIESIATKIQFWYRRTRDENKTLALIDNRDDSLLAKSIMNRRLL